MGVVYHANYLIWMEVARTDLCRTLGVHYKQMEGEGGILLPVTESHCRYISPARYDDEIAVEARVASANRRFVTFEYELTCGGRRIAEGWTKHTFLNPKLRPVRLPDCYAPLFGIE